jgi:exonuclease III
MKMHIITWNVRGLNNPNKRQVVKNMLREWKGDLVCLQDTKINKMELSISEACGAAHS